MIDFREQKHFKRTALIIVVSIAVTLLPSLCGAQVAWQQRQHRIAFNFESYRISMAQTEFYSSWASVFYLSAKIPIIHRIAFVGEIPAAYSGFTGMVKLVHDDWRWMPGEDRIKLGNLYVGMEFTPTDSTYTAEFGLRAPTVSKSLPYTLVMGTMASVDRWGAFLPNRWGLCTMLRGGKTLPSGLAYQLRGGVMFQYPQHPERVTPDLYFQYGARFGCQTQQYSMMLGIQGLYWGNPGADSEGPEFTNVFETLVSADMGRFEPGLRLLVPLNNDFRDVFNIMYGFNVNFVID